MRKKNAKSVKPILVTMDMDHLIVDVCGKQFKVSYEAWERIKDVKFHWSSNIKNATYPLSTSNGYKGINLPNIIFGTRCYTMSTDLYNLLDSNLMSTSNVEDLGKDVIKVHVGNGKSFITDSKHKEYVMSHKWSILELKPGYHYACIMLKNKKLSLLHRYVANATETAQHVDHQNWNTLDNREANLKIVSLSENIHRINPLKKGKKRKTRRA
jgi:hypothetical protein